MKINKPIINKNSKIKKMKKIFKFAKRFVFSNCTSWSKRNQRYLFRTNVFLGTKSKQIKEEIVEKAEKKKNVKEENEKDEEKDKESSEESSEERKKDEKETIERKVTISKEDSLSEFDEEPVVENRNKWDNASKLKDIVHEEYKKNGKEESSILRAIKRLNEEDLFTLKDWKELTEEQKDKDGYPRGLKSVLDKVAGK
jgi:hypothetical protein